MRERHTHTQRDRETETDRQRQTETDRQKDRQTDRQRQRVKEIERQQVAQRAESTLRSTNFWYLLISSVLVTLGCLSLTFH